jgi:hypothetical protein
MTLRWNSTAFEEKRTLTCFDNLAFPGSRMVDKGWRESTAREAEERWVDRYVLPQKGGAKVHDVLGMAIGY